MGDTAFRTAGGESVTAVPAVDGFGIEVLQMMAHAGRALSSAVRERTDGPVTVLAGYGLSGPLAGTAATLTETTAGAATVISPDAPTGVDATTGERPGVAVEPGCVVTLALAKTGWPDWTPMCYSRISASRRVSTGNSVCRRFPSTT